MLRRCAIGNEIAYIILAQIVLDVNIEAGLANLAPGQALCSRLPC